jgi:replication factor C small subunit
MKKDHTLWIERYRSQTLDQYVGNEDIKARIADCITKNDVPHLILSGRAGTGKTTLAKLVVNNIKCDYLYINASDENGIDVIREKVKGFASTASFQPIKIVILDEADFLTQPAQAALRNLIEEYSAYTRFILTCNYLEKLIEPLQSRCEVYVLTPPSKGIVAQHVCNKILDVEKVKYDVKDVAKIINHFYPDIRSVIKTLQQNVKDGKLVMADLNTEWHSQVLSILKKPTKNSWSELRQIIINAQTDDYSELIIYLFENIEKYGAGYEAEITIELDNHQYFQKSVPDKELNCAALMSKILNILNKKQLIKG